jgi:hypothetical protein
MSQERDQEIKPTSFSFRLGYDVFSHFWQPVLALALYKTDFFRLPIVLESERGWRLERIQWSEPSIDIIDDQEGGTEEIPRRDYRVAEEEQGRFTAFTSFFDSTIVKAREFQLFRLAGRRYLRAIQIAGPYSSNGDDYEDALLQHVFALEALLSEGTPAGIGDRIATRAAWLVGTSDHIRHDVFKTVKKLYDARSSIVHGRDRDREERHPRELDETRDLMRRILIGLMALRASVNSDEECLAVLRTAAFSRSSQSHILAATERVWTLLDPGIEWPGASWGPRYDRPEFKG